MRALCVIVAMVALAGCESADDTGAPDLAGCAGPAPFCTIYNGPSICLGNMWWCEGPPRDMAHVRASD